MAAPQMTPASPRYGATENEWLTLDAWHGLTADLLPVVSNPLAVISAESKMRDKGKVPSRYNRQGEVAGFPNWTQYKASPEDIERWKKKADYGICLQTRNVRALDIDVPDLDTALKLEDFIISRLGKLPMRVRANSSKFLLAFRIEGDMPKRVIKVREKQLDESGKVIEPAWLIEFLATGQQFIAAGTHTSGARIEWAGGMPDEFPAVQLADFERLWKDLAATFACEPPHVAGVRRRGEHFEAKDDTADLLDKKGLILGIGNTGQLFIECPWKGDHSSDSGITECAYFPRGSGGYTLGHFKCLHGGCAGRSDTDFEEALGLRDGMFDSLPAIVDKATGQPVKPLPPLERNKNGEIKANLYNLELALAQPEICGVSIRYDEFLDDDIISYPDKAVRPMTDADTVRLRKRLERFGFKPISPEIMRDALTEHGDSNRFDSAKEWLAALPPWDGEERVDTFLTECFGAESTPYARAVSRYIWSALAGRIVRPGVKADMVPILYGEQGTVKSSSIAALAPWEELFTSLSFGEPEKMVRLMRGKLVIELGELRGFHTRELEDIKGFITNQVDEWTPKYKERSTKLHRRCLFIGTTNHSEFLVDETGNRRFLPLAVRMGDIERIKTLRDQLWAEGLAIFQKEGIAFRDAEQLARAEHDKFVVHDSWEESVSAWLKMEDIDGATPAAREYLRLGEVLSGALNIDPRQSNIALEKRAGKVLRKLGYGKVQRTVDGRKTKVFVRAIKGGL